MGSIEAVTDDKALPKAERKQAQVDHAAHIPHGAKLVKIADKTANLRDIANQARSDRAPYLAKSMEWMNNPQAFHDTVGKSSLDATLMSSGGTEP